MKETPADPSSACVPVSSYWRYVGLGLLSHLLWGSYPVFAKRAVVEVPKFSLLVLAALTATAVGWVLWGRQEREFVQFWSTLRRRPILWALTLFWVLRSITNIISIELTRAVWVQLINILTPFPVALLGAWIFHQPVPRFTYRALLLSLLGSSLMLVPDWSQLDVDFAPRDVLGLATAVLSTLILATYYQLVRRSRLTRSGGGLIMLHQGIATALTHTVLTLSFHEDWRAWTHVSPMGWLAVLGAILLAQVAGNLIQILAVGGANPALVSSFMPLRLVSALLLGWLVLGERLVTPLQWLGMIIVILTITGYLWLQRESATVSR